MKWNHRIWLGLAAACVFVPGVLFAQSAADAKAFLLENMRNEWYGRGEDSGAYASSKLVGASCGKFELQKCFRASVDKEAPPECWTETFDPTLVRAFVVPFEGGGNRPRVMFNCYSGQCISRTATSYGGPASDASDAMTLVDSERITKAYDVFQASCGGPKKPAF